MYDCGVHKSFVLRILIDTRLILGSQIAVNQSFKCFCNRAENKSGRHLHGNKILFSILSLLVEHLDISFFRNRTFKDKNNTHSHIASTLSTNPVNVKSTVFVVSFYCAFIQRQQHFCFNSKQISILNYSEEENIYLFLFNGHI